MSDKPMDQQQTDVENTATDSTFSPGANLRRVRESLGLTEEEVAIQLHLSKNMVEAIESDAYDKLPGVTFIRGYLRGYAKLLNISADEHIAAFNKLFPYTQENTPYVRREHQRIIINQKRPGEQSARWVGYGIVGILVILVFIWWHNHNTQQDDLATQTALTTTQNEVASAATTSVNNANVGLPAEQQTLPATPAENAVNNPVLPNAETPAASTAMTGVQPSSTITNATQEMVNGDQSATATATGQNQTTGAAPAAKPTRWQKAKNAIWHDPDNANTH